MKTKRKVLIIILAFFAIALCFQTASAASDSCTTQEGYYCSYSITISGGSANANITASKSSGALVNPLTAAISGIAITQYYPNGIEYCNSKTVFDDNVISCSAFYTSVNDHVYSSADDYYFNGRYIDTLIEYVN